MCVFFTNCRTTVNPETPTVPKYIGTLSDLNKIAYLNSNRFT